MSEKRLSDLAILSIERDISDTLELEIVVDKFAHRNRRITLELSLHHPLCTHIIILILHLSVRPSVRA